MIRLYLRYLKDLFHGRYPREITPAAGRQLVLNSGTLEQLIAADLDDFLTITARTPTNATLNISLGVRSLLLGLTFYTRAANGIELSYVSPNILVNNVGANLGNVRFWIQKHNN